MNDFIASSFFKEFFIPMLSVFLTGAVKVVSRRDGQFGITREDYAIGIDLVVTSLVLLTTYASRIANDVRRSNPAVDLFKCRERLEMLPWLLIFYILGLWALSTIVRIKGWESSPSNRIHRTWGVWIPTIIGIILLLATVRYIE
ncbi:hypothetical protein GCM10028803_50360 [Larkinella knui]|uniref:Uncharacterized protein n=1 Tax=Larkinella knui TaxID=2025310 RepID=A0A3P1CQR9_9BACT|nr:hypothetical protein [Larkinella knui]RRB15598.1 hypothetical protein EHT87_13865 [Larkinella knui]